jgi:transposase-like protein
MTGPGGILEQLTKRVYERILGAEMTHYLGYEKGHASQRAEGKKHNNHRNGTSKKTQFIRKGQRRFGGFDQKIIAMYAPRDDGA